MMNTIAVSGLLILSAARTQTAQSPEDVQTPDRPNIVLICMEGVPVSATGFGGHPHVKTPHLDEIAAQAANFSRAYTPMPQPVGAHASILTGQFPHTHGVTDAEKQIRANGIAVSEALSEAGYRCGLVGVWSLPESSQAADQAADQADAPSAGSPIQDAARNLAGQPGQPTHRPGFMHPPEVPLPRPAQPSRGRVPQPEPGFRGPMTQPSEIQPSASQPSQTQPAETQPEYAGAASAISAATQPAETQPAVSEVPATQPGGMPAFEGLSAEALEAMKPAAVEPPPLPRAEKPGLGFDYSATSPPGGPLSAATVYVDGEQKIADAYLPQWHAERAAEFIHSSKDRPFFLCVFLPGPGETLEYPPDSQDAYPPDSLPKPRIDSSAQNKLPTRLRTMPIMQRAPKQPRELREQLSKYYTFVSELDRQVGRVMAALSDAGIDEQTLVVVTANSGFATGESGAWGMGPLFWEELIRCPLLVHMPSMTRKTAQTAPCAEISPENESATQVAEGSGDAEDAEEPRDARKTRVRHASNRAAQIEAMVSLVDLAPTILEVAGLHSHPNMQGRSLLPLIAGDDDPYRADECFIEYEQSEGQPYPVRVLVAGQYKLVEYLQDSDQFYDMKRDPAETRNLIDERAYAALIKVMRSRLDHWRKRTKDQ